MRAGEGALTNEVDNGHEAYVLANGGLHNILGYWRGGVAICRLRHCSITIHNGPSFRLQVTVPVHGHQGIGEASGEGQAIASHNSGCINESNQSSMQMPNHCRSLGARPGLQGQCRRLYDRAYWQHK